MDTSYGGVSRTGKGLWGAGRRKQRRRARRRIEEVIAVRPGDDPMSRRLVELVTQMVAQERADVGVKAGGTSGGGRKGN